MDFFEAQSRAKKRTSRLVLLFALAVAGTVLAGYAAALVITRQMDGHGSLWQPGLFAMVALGTCAVVGVASLFKWTQFRAGGSAVAESLGARRVEPNTTDLNERKLLNVVEEMAIASGVPLPASYVLDDEPGINAFAAGMTTSDSVVAVTRGVLDKLSRDEIQGIVGHEFSHILNGDTRLNMRLTSIVFGILVIGLAGRGILQSIGRGRIRVGSGKNKGGGLAAIVAVGVALMVVGYVGYFFGRLIQSAVSRQREYLADASSVQFTRNPGGLTGALKKIGGYALGSSLQSSKSTAIGHFFFAQGFRSMFGGAWATHPPLGDRIRAIDPHFDGKFIEPPEVVDVANEPWGRPGTPANAAGFAPGALAQSAARGLTATAASPALSERSGDPAKLPGRRRDTSFLAPQTAPLITGESSIAQAGSLTPESVSNAQNLLASLPPRLRAAAKSQTEAPVVLYGLILDDEPDIRARQRSLVAGHAGADALRVLDELDAPLRRLVPGQKLPLLQLALPPLKELNQTALGSCLETLDELVHADNRVTTFEFALQKLVLHTLSLNRDPSSAIVQIYSFNAVAQEISLVLSALAHASSEAAASAERAFGSGAAQLKLLDGRISFLPAGECGFAPLDAALDKLATSSAPIKQRLLVAAEHVVSTDGTVLPAEAELLRAIAATLDVPLPPAMPDSA